MADESIYDQMKNAGLSRRSFLKVCGLLAGAMGVNMLPPIEESGLPAHLPGRTRIIQEVGARPKASSPPVLWLEFQDCAGCSEALTASQSPPWWTWC